MYLKALYTKGLNFCTYCMDLRFNWSYEPERKLPVFNLFVLSHFSSPATTKLSGHASQGLYCGRIKPAVWRAGFWTWIAFTANYSHVYGQCQWTLLSLMREFEVHAESASFQTHAEFLADKPYDI